MEKTEEQKKKRQEYHKKWREINRKKLKTQQRKYYWKNREKILAYTRAYKYKNHERWKEYERGYMKKWRAEHPHYKCPKRQLLEKKNERRRHRVQHKKD